MCARFSFGKHEQNLNE